MFKRLGVFLLDIVEVVVFAVGIFFFVYLLVMRPHKISGQSMMPNFQDGEFILTEKVTYYSRNPQRGDVVVFTPPTSNADEYIKRVIGLPGETVMVKEGHVYINDKLLKEPYLKDTVFTTGGSFLSEGSSYTVPEGQYFVLGDNRPNSSDSRYFGPIKWCGPLCKGSSISGRAWVAYWPANLAGVVAGVTYEY